MLVTVRHVRFKNTKQNDSSCTTLEVFQQLIQPMTITINRRWRYSKHYNSQMSELRLICLRFAKIIKKFYRAANGNFGKIGRVASEEVILHLISSKCLPILLYGLESLPLYQYKLNSLDFVINRFFKNYSKLPICILSLLCRKCLVLSYRVFALLVVL